MDFTLRKYDALLQAFQNAGYEVYTFRRYLQTHPSVRAPKFVILRHDVDRLPENSHATALLEQQRQMCATYFFRRKPCSDRSSVIVAISDMGHEIGYHYEDVGECKGNLQEAWEHFQNALAHFRNFAEVNTICMHGAPVLDYDNHALWNEHDYRSLGVIGDTLFDTDYDDVFYITDTGRRWDGYKVSRRDNVPQQQDWIKRGFSYHSTDDIIRAVDSNQFPHHVMMTTHPQRWTDRPLPWIREFLLQNAKNVVKFFLIRIKKSKQEE